MNKKLFAVLAASAGLGIMAGCSTIASHGFSEKSASYFIKNEHGANVQAMEQALQSAIKEPGQPPQVVKMNDGSEVMKYRFCHAGEGVRLDVKLEPTAARNGYYVTFISDAAPAQACSTALSGLKLSVAGNSNETVIRTVNNAVLALKDTAGDAMPVKGNLFKKPEGYNVEALD